VEACCSRVLITFHQYSYPSSTFGWTFDGKVDQITCNILNSMNPGSCIDPNNINTGLFFTDGLPSFLFGRTMMFDDTYALNVYGYTKTNIDFIYGFAIDNVATMNFLSGFSKNRCLVFPVENNQYHMEIWDNNSKEKLVTILYYL